MRPSHIEDALAQLHTGQWYGWSDPKNKIYSNIVVLDNAKPHPTEKEVNDKLAFDCLMPCLQLFYHTLSVIRLIYH